MDLVGEFILIIAIMAISAVVALLFGFPFMWLWNWLMPELFGLKLISYWQSVGLMILTGMIFRSASSSGSKD